MTGSSSNKAAFIEAVKEGDTALAAASAFSMTRTCVHRLTPRGSISTLRQSSIAREQDTSRW